MNRIVAALLVLAWTQFSTPRFSEAATVGDCVAMYFYKPGCQQCQEMQRPIEQVIESGWAVRGVDVEREPEVAMRWHVMRFPTMVLVRNSREVDRIIDKATAQQIHQRLLAGSSPDSIRDRTPSNIPATGLTVRGQSVAAVVPMATAAFAAGSIMKHNSFTSSPPQASSRFVDPSLATVRIRVDEPSHEAIGTGTIIDTFQGEALVLTCGHLFRDTKGKTPIIVETFSNGFPKQYSATLIDYRADTADIGLVAFRPEGEVGVVRLMDHQRSLREGDAVYSWGCDQGALPSRRDSRISKLNRYQGEPNVEVLGAPVQGRSGGGLFNANGELIGVCYAADSERYNEGLYNAPEVVYQQLNRLGLQRLYSNTTASPSIASAQAPQQDKPKVTVLVEQNGTTNQWQIENPTPDLIRSLQQQSSRTATSNGPSPSLR